jgi:ABC-type lipoprotein export system ATPase subunit
VTPACREKHFPSRCDGCALRRVEPDRRHRACGIDFEVRHGEIFGLIGPDGAGKTTTFNVLAGILEPTSGDVSLLGEPPGAARLNVGYLTQQFSLFDGGQRDALPLTIALVRQKERRLRQVVMSAGNELRLGVERGRECGAGHRQEGRVAACREFRCIGTERRSVKCVIVGAPRLKSQDAG